MRHSRWPPHAAGTVTLDGITVTTATGVNSAQYISGLVVEDVTVGGVPVAG